jgi:DNA replication licensing factor MCM2
MHVRIVQVPLADRLRDLRQKDLNKFIRVCGVVTRRTGVCPQLRAVAYSCSDCNHLLGPFVVPSGGSADSIVRPKACPVCASTALATNSQKSQYGNYQRLTLQEAPGSVDAGRPPRSKDVIVLGDLIDVVKPGEEVEVTGVFTQVHSSVGGGDRSGFPVLNTVIEANHLHKKNSATNSGISEEDKRKIRELANDPRVSKMI